MNAEFCDTNVFVYAYDATAGIKHERARALIERLWQEQSGAVSVQVLQELFVTLTRKIPHPLHPSVAREIVADLASWQVVAPTAADVLDAVDGSTRWQLSFWDAMIIVAAARGGATVVWSEDLQDGQQFESVTVKNPLRPA